MSRYESDTAPFQVAGAIGQYLACKDNGSGKLVVCTADDPPLCFTAQQTFAADEWVSGYLPSARGSIPAIGSAAIAKGARVSTGANGKMAADAAGEWQALTACGADGEVFQIVPALANNT